MPRAAARLDAWLESSGLGSGRGDQVLDDVRNYLDADLDTPGAVTAIDDAVAQGEDVSEAAALLGVLL